MADAPAPSNAQVEGSGTGVKFRKMSVLLELTEKLPIPRLFENEDVLIAKSVALNPEIEVAESSVHW
jgi:hypothetical protein